MVNIISAFRPSDNGASGSIADSLKSIGQSIWGDEAKNEGYRQNALKLQRENDARERGSAALRSGNAVETLAQGFRGGVGAPDATGYIRGYYGNTKGADSPEFEGAAVGAGEPWHNTPRGSREVLANQRAMEQDRTDASRYTPIYSQDVYGNKTPSGTLNTRNGQYNDMSGMPVRGGGQPPAAPKQTGMQPVGMSDELPGAGDDGVNHGHFSQLANENPEIASHVAAVLDGREPFPTLQTMRNNPMAQAVSRHVSLTEPGFDATKWYGRKRTSDYFSGVGGGAVATKSANQAIKHMYDLAGYAEALHNKEGLGPLTQPYNALANHLSTASGGTAPGQFNLTRKAAVDEIAKLFKGANLSDTEIHQWDQLVSDAQTNPQHRANLGAALQLYGHGVDALEEMRREGLSPLSKGRVQPLLSPETQELMRRLHGWSQGQPLNAAPAKAQGQLPQGAPQPVVTPQSQAGPGPQDPTNAATPQEGERRQFKQGWGVFHNGQWGPAQ